MALTLKPLASSPFTGILLKGRVQSQLANKSNYERKGAGYGRNLHPYLYP